MTIDAKAFAHSSKINTALRSWGKVQVVGTPQPFTGKSQTPDDRDDLLDAAVRAQKATDETIV